MTKAANRAREIDLGDFTSSLDWKQFEGLAIFAFNSFGFKVLRNYRMTKPKMEIDIVAIRNSKAFAADCKRWKRTVGESSMVIAAGKQIERAKRILVKERLNQVVPVIITWREEAVRVLENGVPIVPIRKLSDFILNFESSGERILVIDGTD
ncbi:MAG: NERD domain-containing protein [Nitrososphaerales archaeon]